VVEGTWGKWVMEVKTGGYARHDLAGLLEFIRRFPEYRPLLVCDEPHIAAARATGVEGISWQQFLWSGVEEL